MPRREAEVLRDRRPGRVSPRRAPAAELARMHRLYREEDAAFTAKHFHEELRGQHSDTLGYAVARLSLQAVGLVARVKSRGAHRRKR